MPRPRFAKLDPQRQSRILHEAASEFAERGYERASLNRIVQRAGVSKGALYYYFDDKADLLVTTLRHFLGHLVPAAPIVIADLDVESFWLSLETLCDEAMRRARAEPVLIGLGGLVYHPPADRRVREAIADEFSSLHRLLHEFLEHGQRLGLVRSDLPDQLLLQLTAATLESGDRWLVENWDRLPAREIDAAARALVQMVRAMLAPPGAAR